MPAGFWVDGIKKNFWLNTKNPLYRELLAEGKAGNNKVQIIQIGTQADTKYQLVKK